VKCPKHHAVWDGGNTTSIIKYKTILPKSWEFRARVLECWFMKNLWEIKNLAMDLQLFFYFCNVIMTMIN